MATGEVVGSIFFAANELLWMEKLAVCSGPHLVNNCWLQINKHGTWNVLSGASFTEEGVEGIISSSDGSTAPSKSFRPGYRPDRCGSKCTLSFSQIEEKNKSENKKKKGERK
ncbi:hypothetical protein F8388_020210 [Cannabis sativa]|uniref:Uncharacterized protein n=1 Tax=Cannabis sativa TaxID=3483 RepID=A0A7J6FY98_CANSA|nr:hypothetical protein F8388_020210 [Cannabis sativa]